MNSRGPSGILSGAWRPAGVIYLAVLLLALAIGLWPDAFRPVPQRPRPAPLPTLQMQAAAQAAFILLIYPLVCLCRAARDRPGRYWAAVLAESAVFVLIGLVFSIPAGYLADATVSDAMRAAMYVALLFPLAWAAGAHFKARRRAAWAVLLGLVLVALALPAAHYIALEFFPPGPAEPLGRLAPLLFAWHNSASRLAATHPEPLWAWLIWPATAALWLLGSLSLGRVKENKS